MEGPAARARRGTFWQYSVQDAQYCNFFNCCPFFIIILVSARSDASREEKLIFWSNCPRKFQTPDLFQNLDMFILEAHL